MYISERLLLLRNIFAQVFVNRLQIGAYALHAILLCGRRVEQDAFGTCVVNRGAIRRNTAYAARPCEECTGLVLLAHDVAAEAEIFMR